MYDPENPSPLVQRERPSKKSSNPERPSDSVMRALWARMCSIYPHKWASAVGESFGESGIAGREWQAGLEGITPQQIEAGIAECRISTDPWPPSIGEFRVMCLPKVNPHPTNDWKNQLANPDKVPDQTRTQWHLDNIREMFKQSQPQHTPDARARVLPDEEQQP